MVLQCSNFVLLFSLSVPSIPLDLAATHVTNESLSFAWRIPAKPNGVSPTYLVYRNGVLVKEFAVTKVRIPRF